MNILLSQDGTEEVQMADFIRDAAALLVVGAFVGTVALWSMSLSAMA